MTSLLVFGFGGVGEAVARRLAAEGWEIAATARDPDKRARLAGLGLTALDPADREAMDRAVARARAVLVTAPPGINGCPGLPAIVPALARGAAFPDWIGYLSTTGVYGDRGGGWVFEDSELNAPTVEGARRAAAERDWNQVGAGMGLSVCSFRLPALYGPGRSPFDRLREGTARLVKKPGQVFNRIYVEDAAEGIVASLRRPHPGRAYNICDDEPAPADAVMAFAAMRLDLKPPPELPWTDPSVTDAMRRFYVDNKRVSNARAKAELGWRPRFPTYREGLEEILRVGG